MGLIFFARAEVSLGLPPRISIKASSSRGFVGRIWDAYEQGISGIDDSSGVFVSKRTFLPSIDASITVSLWMTASVLFSYFRH